MINKNSGGNKVIFITGDTHIPHDIDKLNEVKFSEQLKLSKKDYVIICGDFGGVWDNAPERVEWLDWLEKRNFTTLFVDGNHENFDILNSMPIENWCGGDVHFIRPSIIHLMRGQVFTIDGHTFFTFGGAYSFDKSSRAPGISWWPEEIPSDEEQAEGFYNLAEYDYEVDYIISHTCPYSILDEFPEMLPKMLNYFDSTTEEYLEKIKNNTDYQQWFFGHWHSDIDFDGVHTLLYNRIIPIE